MSALRAKHRIASDCRLGGSPCWLAEDAIPVRPEEPHEPIFP